METVATSLTVYSGAYTERTAYVMCEVSSSNDTRKIRCERTRGVVGVAE